MENWVLDRTRRLSISLHPLFRGDRRPRRHFGASIRLARWISKWLGLDRRREEEHLGRPSPIGTTDSHDGAIATIPDPPRDIPLVARFKEVTSVVWNQPRSVTLVAGESVEMLLVKCKALMEIIKGFPALYEETLAEFLNVIFPRRLAANRLIRGLDGKVDLDRLRELIAGQAGKDSGLLLLEKYDKDQTIIEQGSVSDSLYLIMGGTVRVTRRELGGTVLLNHREIDDYFGESCIYEGARRSVAVEAITRVYTLKIGREAITRIVDTFPILGDRLRGERERTTGRVRDTVADRLSPPATEPPQEVASKLMLATNLLLIDMNRCTRCDQCVPPAPRPMRDDRGSTAPTPTPGCGSAAGRWPRLASTALTPPAKMPARSAPSHCLTPAPCISTAIGA